MGNFFFESPLAWAITLRGLARCSLGHSGWRDDLQAGLAMAREVQGITQSAVTTYCYGVALMNGAGAGRAEWHALLRRRAAAAACTHGI
jgi:adenylate cyclase